MQKNFITGVHPPTARAFRLAVTLVLLTLAMSRPARAQGSRRDDIVLNPQGHPIPGAIITVCTATATGTPCSPLAALFTDATLTVPSPNPFTTDYLGNYHFYAAPGRYIVQIAGSGILGTKQMNDVILPNDPSTPSFSTVTTSGAISALTLSLGGNLSVTGNATITGSLTANSLSFTNLSVPGNLTVGGLLTTASLSGLSSPIVPTTAGGTTLGSASLPFSSLYLGAAATNNIQITGTATAPRTFTLPDANSNPVQPFTCASSNWVNAISSAGLKTCSQPALSDLAPGTAGAGTYDFSGVTLFKLRVGAGLTTSVNGDLGEDTANFLWHLRGNGVDSFLHSTSQAIYDVVAQGGADPSGIADSAPAFTAAHNFFNGKNGGTITGCGTFKLLSTVVITNPSLSFVASCGPGGNAFANSGGYQRGGFVLTGGTGNEQIPTPTVAPTLACSNSGGGLATGTYSAEYTWKNGFGETQASPSASCSVTGPNGSVQLKGVTYTNGGFAFNLYWSNGGAFSLEPNTSYKGGAGGLIGPPFVLTASATLQGFSGTGAAPPGSNTTTHGLTLVQVGTPSGTVKNGPRFDGVYFWDNGGKLAAGLVILNAQHTEVRNLGADGFTANGTALGGGAPYEQGGIAVVATNLGDGSPSTTNFTTFYKPEIFNNTLGMFLSASDTSIFGGDITATPGQVGADYPGGNVHISKLHLNTGSGTNSLPCFVARGNNDQSHYGGDLDLKSECTSTAATILLRFMRNMRISQACGGSSSGAGAPCIQINDTSSGPNLLQILTTVGSQCAFSDGTTCGNDVAKNNLIEGPGNAVQAPSLLSAHFQSYGNAPSCSSTNTGTSTCSLDSGSSDSAGTMTITITGGSPAANGTVTLTFNSALGANNPACLMGLSDAGTGSWNPRATIQDNSPTTASDVQTWDNNGAALTNAAWKINYWCAGK